MKIQIGEMAELMGVSNQTLHHYDSIGLLKPEIDHVNGYRFYNQYHCYIMDTILSLKNTGMKLNEIKKFTEEQDVSINIEMLSSRIYALDRKIDLLSNTKTQLSSKLESFKHLTGKPDIGFVELGEMHLAEISRPPGSGEVAAEKYLRKLLKYVKKLENQLIINIIATKDLRDLSDKMDSDLELKSFAVPLSDAFPDSPYYRLIDAGVYAYIFHNGDYEDSYKSYMPLMSFIADNGYSACGDSVERPIVDNLFTVNPKSFITEILIPVEALSGGAL
jgi:DNA-binding transcriptional MerR regulator